MQAVTDHDPMGIVRRRAAASFHSDDPDGAFSDTPGGSLNRAGAARTVAPIRG